MPDTREIDKLKFQLETQYKRDKFAIERILQILDRNYQDQMRSLDELATSVTSPEMIIPEYIPPEVELDTSSNGAVRREVRQAAARAKMALANEVEVINVDAKAPESEEEILLKLVSALGVPCTINTINRAWAQSGYKRISGTALQALLKKLRQEKGIDYYQIREQDGQKVVYYQSVNAAVPLKTAIARMLASRRQRTEVAAQAPPTPGSVEAILVGDAAPVKHGEVPASPEVIPQSLPIRRRRRERR